MKRLSSIVLLALTALAVSACGMRGNLERPPPLWGDPPQTEAASEDETEADNRR